MVTIQEVVSLEVLPERRNFRLKNKKLETVRRKPAACTGPNIAEERLEDMLCSAFTLPVFFSLLPHELANLEATCRCFKEALNGENATLIWIASAYAASRAHRLVLPVESFARTFEGMPLVQIKHTLANMKYARGFLNDGPVPLSTDAEFNAVSNVCTKTAADKVVDPSSAIRVVTGRLTFRQTEMMICLPTFDEEEEEEEDDDNDEDDEDDDGEMDLKMYYSNEMNFCWTGRESPCKGTMLVASLGLLNGANVLEISSVIKPLKSPIELSVDVHLVSSLWPEALVAEGIKLRVDGSCSGFEIPQLDISDPSTRKVLMSPKGILCILVVRNLPDPEVHAHSSRSAQAETPTRTSQARAPPVTQASTASNLNALSLSFPSVACTMPPPKRVF